MKILRARDKKDLADKLLQAARTEEKAGASQMQTVHIVDEGMTPEKPMRVRPFQAVLENPSFSSIGLILISSTFTIIPIYSLVQLYWAFRATDRTLHLYRIPKNRSVEKTVEEHEKCQSISLDKPPQTHRSLHFGTCPGVPSVSDAVINPADLKFTYIGPENWQPYTRDMEEGMQIRLTKQKYFTSERESKPLWTAFLRAGDVEHPASVSDPPTGRSTGKTTRDLLVNTLDDLGESELKNFKSKLTDIDLKEGYDHIPKGKLENAKSIEVTDLLIGHYTMDYVMEVTTIVLEAINRKDLARRLRSITRTGEESAWAWPCLPVPQNVTQKYPYSPLLYNYDKFCTMHTL
ncbi:caspase recruitment domain-containing protein 8-like [Dermochelys coriacea]|uniref:caspase recruitment domain-containing protein 8-like n=1 Tax=Dermochelys coriacea TaxID=27794 RepID=UPI0018E8CEFB|nr:caspase recruitment domain-containing protein 8-like [Dermochelys coriacea]